MAATIGEQLRTAREGRGIPLREISDQTRISMHYLEAIETNDYKRLPGGIFNRSFVKAYARYVGFDEKEAVEGYTRYMRELGDSGDEVASTPYHSKVYTDAPATRHPILTVLLAIVILTILTMAALAVLHWVQRRSADTSHEAPFAMRRPGLTGIAGVSPASSNRFIQGSAKPDSLNNLAFNECGRDARGPSKMGPSEMWTDNKTRIPENLVCSLDKWKADYEPFLQ